MRCTRGLNLSPFVSFPSRSYFSSPSLTSFLPQLISVVSNWNSCTHRPHIKHTRTHTHSAMHKISQVSCACAEAEACVTSLWPTERTETCLVGQCDTSTIQRCFYPFPHSSVIETKINTVSLWSRLTFWGHRLGVTGSALWKKEEADRAEVRSMRCQCFGWPTLYRKRCNWIIPHQIIIYVTLYNNKLVL